MITDGHDKMALETDLMNDILKFKKEFDDCAN